MGGRRPPGPWTSAAVRDRRSRSAPRLRVGTVVLVRAHGSHRDGRREGGVPGRTSGAGGLHHRITPAVPCRPLSVARGRRPGQRAGASVPTGQRAPDGGRHDRPRHVRPGGWTRSGVPGRTGRDGPLAPAEVAGAGLRVRPCGEVRPADGGRSRIRHRTLRGPARGRRRARPPAARPALGTSVRRRGRGHVPVGGARGGRGASAAAGGRRRPGHAAPRRLVQSAPRPDRLLERGAQHGAGPRRSRRRREGQRGRLGGADALGGRRRLAAPRAARHLRPAAGLRPRHPCPSLGRLGSAGDGAVPTGTRRSPDGGADDVRDRRGTRRLGAPVQRHGPGLGPELVQRRDVRRRRRRRGAPAGRPVTDRRPRLPVPGRTARPPR